MTTAHTAELTAKERALAGLPVESTSPVFDLDAWLDGSSPAWEALAKLSETDPVSAGNIINSWRTEVGGQAVIDLERSRRARHH